jgi:WW domain
MEFSSDFLTAPPFSPNQICDSRIQSCLGNHFEKTIPNLHPFTARYQKGNDVMNGLPPTPAIWQEARTADGRVYYYNAQTKITQWTKPTELMTPLEVRSLLQTGRLRRVG